MSINIEIIGLFAAFFTTASFLPQVIKTWRTKEVENLSLTMYFAMLTGVVLWLIYGVKINSLSMVIANVITTLLVCIIIVLKLRYK